MARRRNTVYYLVTAVVFVVLEAAAITLVCLRGPVQNSWMTAGTHWIMDEVWGGVEGMKYYFSLNRENNRLAEENEKLYVEIARHQSDSLREAYSLGIADTIDNFVYLPAKIRKVSTNRQHNYLILDKGSDDGVRPLSGVVTEIGVLGVVDAVSRHYCYARSIRNPDMEVSARLGMSGPLGTLSWDGLSNDRAILNGIPRHIEVAKGDTVFTSGYSNIFPADIPLGTVASAGEGSGTHYIIHVRMFTDVHSRRFATIAYNIDRDEIEKLEETGHE
ncbi:MAG: rod shape-determining protein MreC [Bacteroidales bacterium]|nr:rod shape-determining protein MreC [Bacteroidales bacterium]